MSEHTVESDADELDFDKPTCACLRDTECEAHPAGLDALHGGIEQRVWMHWKSMKRSCYREFVVDRVGDGLTPGGLVFGGHWELRFPNSGWLHLARVHKMKVRRVKDIVNARRASVTPSGSTQETER